MKKAALRSAALGFLILAIVTVIVGVDRAIAAWPAQVETATFQSPADGSEQKTLVYLPPGDEPVPLLVGFHTWSGDFMQDESAYAEWCIARGWAMLHPDLRGPANRPEAAGSGSASGVRIPWQRPALRLSPGPPEADERRTAPHGLPRRPRDRARSRAQLARSPATGCGAGLADSAACASDACPACHRFRQVSGVAYGPSIVPVDVALSCAKTVGEWRCSRGTLPAWIDRVTGLFMTSRGLGE